MYSYYYWFVAFKGEYIKKYGKNEGLEQQAFKVLEAIDVELANGVDWSIIEQIDSELNQEM